MGEFVSRAEYEEHNLRMEDEHKRMHHRLDSIERAGVENNKLLVSVEKLALSMENMQKELKEQGCRLSELEERDGEMWRKAVGHIVTFSIGAVLAFIFAQIGI